MEKLVPLNLTLFPNRFTIDGPKMHLLLVEMFQKVKKFENPVCSILSELLNLRNYREYLTARVTELDPLMYCKARYTPDELISIARHEFMYYVTKTLDETRRKYETHEIYRNLPERVPALIEDMAKTLLSVVWPKLLDPHHKEKLPMLCADSSSFQFNERYLVIQALYELELLIPKYVDMLSDHAYSEGIRQCEVPTRNSLVERLAVFPLGLITHDTTNPESFRTTYLDPIMLPDEKATRDTVVDFLSNTLAYDSNKTMREFESSLATTMAVLSKYVQYETYTIVDQHLRGNILDRKLPPRTVVDPPNRMYLRSLFTSLTTNAFTLGYLHNLARNLRSIVLVSAFQFHPSESPCPVDINEIRDLVATASEQLYGDKLFVEQVGAEVKKTVIESIGSVLDSFESILSEIKAKEKDWIDKRRAKYFEITDLQRKMEDTCRQILLTDEKRHWIATPITDEALQAGCQTVAKFRVVEPELIPSSCWIQLQCEQLRPWTDKTRVSELELLFRAGRPSLNSKLVVSSSASSSKLSYSEFVRILISQWFMNHRIVSPVK